MKQKLGLVGDIEQMITIPDSPAELEQRIADLEREQREMKLQLSEIYMKIVGGEKNG